MLIITSTLVADSGCVLQEDRVAIQERNFGGRRDDGQGVAHAESEFANVQFQRHGLDALSDAALSGARHLKKNENKNKRMKFFLFKCRSIGR